MPSKFVLQQTAKLFSIPSLGLAQKVLFYLIHTLLSIAYGQARLGITLSIPEELPVFYHFFEITSWEADIFSLNIFD